MFAAEVLRPGSSITKKKRSERGPKEIAPDEAEEEDWGTLAHIKKGKRKANAVEGGLASVHSESLGKPP
jgi:hypothetical protein